MLVASQPVPNVQYLVVASYLILTPELKIYILWLTHAIYLQESPSRRVLWCVRIITVCVWLCCYGKNRISNLL